MLLVLVVFGVGIIRTFFTPEKTRAFLSGKSEFAGNVLAALLGIVTPFCSCSAVPLFIGFVTAGVPLGVTFSFLIAAPMVNEIALGLLYALLGWKIAAIYMGTGLFIAIFAGWVIGRLKLEGHIEEWVTQANTEQAEDEAQRCRQGRLVCPEFKAVVMGCCKAVKQRHRAANREQCQQRQHQRTGSHQDALYAVRYARSPETAQPDIGQDDGSADHDGGDLADAEHTGKCRACRL